MFDAVKNIKILIDEDLSPAVARNLCEELLIDAVAVRDRGLLGMDDRSILEYALKEDRILVTANVGDFERFARACEVHAGIIFISEGDLLRSEQIAIVFFGSGEVVFFNRGVLEAQMSDKRGVSTVFSADERGQFERLEKDGVQKILQVFGR